MKIPTTPAAPQLQPQPTQPQPSIFISAKGYIPLSFHSHAAKKAALGRRQILTDWILSLDFTNEWLYRSVYSEKRSSKGGIYLVREDIAKDILSRRRKRKEITGGLVGIRVIRPPYDDLKWCY